MEWLANGGKNEIHEQTNESTIRKTAFHRVRNEFHVAFRIRNKTTISCFIHFLRLTVLDYAKTRIFSWVHLYLISLCVKNGYLCRPLYSDTDLVMGVVIDVAPDPLQDRCFYRYCGSTLKP